MPRDQIIEIVLRELADHRAHDIQDVVHSALQNSQGSHESLYESDVKSAVLGLVRRNQIELTDDFKVQLPMETPVAI